MAQPVKCPNCERSVTPNAQGQCPYCGTKMPSPADALGRTQALSLAQRFDKTDLRGFIQKGFDVPFGTRALLLRNGALDDTLPAGYHSVQSLGDRFSSFLRGDNIEAIVIREGEIELTLVFGEGHPQTQSGETFVRRMIASDHLEVSVQIGLRLIIDRPELFAREMMAGRKSIEANHLSLDLSEPAAQAIQQVVTTHTASELTSAEPVRQQAERAVEGHVSQWLAARGVRLVRIDSLGFFSPHVEAAHGAERKLWEMNAREAFAARADEIQRKGLTRETLRELFEKRTDQEKHEILNQLEEKSLLSEQNLAIVKRTILEEEDNYSLAREFFKQRTGLLNSGELEKLAQAQRIEIEKTQSGHERDEALASAKSQVEIDRIEFGLAMEIKRQRAELDFWEKERNYAIEREHRKGIKDIDREDDLTREAHKAKMLAEMAAAGPEALIAWADSPQKAQLLAELRKTEALKGMSEEQILALAAKDSAAVAEAFKEKYRAMGSDRVEALYKQMLQDKSGTADQLQQMFNKALDSQGSSAVGVSHGAGPKTGGYMGMPSAPGEYGGAPVTLLCPKCNTPNPPTGNFCINCGQKLRG